MTPTLPPPVLEHLPPPPPPPPPPAAPPSVAVRHVYATAPSATQAWATRLSRLVLGVALWFGVVGLLASHWALSNRTASAPPGETFLHWTTWGHHTEVSGYHWSVAIAYPPVGVVVALLMALAVEYTRMDIGRLLWRARRMNGRPRTWRRDPETVIALATSRRNLSARGVRGRFVRRERGPVIALLTVSMVGSLALALLGWYARGTNLPDNDLVAGVGPTVCIVAGVIAFVAGLVAMPWHPDRRLAIGPDGEVDEVRTPIEDRSRGGGS